MARATLRPSRESHHVHVPWGLMSNWSIPCTRSVFSGTFSSEGLMEPDHSIVASLLSVTVSSYLPGSPGLAGFFTAPCTRTRKPLVIVCVSCESTTKFSTSVRAYMLPSRHLVSNVQPSSRQRVLVHVSSHLRRPWRPTSPAPCIRRRQLLMPQAAQPDDGTVRMRSWPLVVAVIVEGVVHVPAVGMTATRGPACSVKALGILTLILSPGATLQGIDGNSNSMSEMEFTMGDVSVAVNCRDSTLTPSYSFVVKVPAATVSDAVMLPIEPERTGFWKPSTVKSTNVMHSPPDRRAQLTYERSNVTVSVFVAAFQAPACLRRGR
eukprot:PhM_4_TR1294/c1_g1_i1/m.35699